MRLAFVPAALIALGAAALLAADKPDKGMIDFQLDVTKGPLKVKAGDKGAVKLVIKPQAGAHVDPRPPMSIAAKASGAVEITKALLQYKDGKEVAEKAFELEVPFVAKAAGADKIEVHADFYLCNPTVCERQVTDVAVPVVVE